MIIIFFIITHWYMSLFFQTFFLHRYVSHRMFRMNIFWEKTFFLATFLIQGSSFLNPVAYGLMHRKHHKYSDTSKDPHSPLYFNNFFSFMWQTFREYRDLTSNILNKEVEYVNFPRFKIIEFLGELMITRILFIFFYIAFYWFYASSFWLFLLIPIHIFMGPIHGFIVNWFGHKAGYRNYNNLPDNSKNTLPVDILMMGELYQNNHHNSPTKSKFSDQWFEIDFAYFFIVILKKIKILY